MNSGNASRLQFGQYAELYRKSKTHSDSTTLNHIIELISPRQRDRALDVGCGGGHMAAALAEKVGGLVAVDITPEMLVQTGKLAEEKGIENLSFCLADARNLPFQANTFDVVSCRIVIHHIDDAEKAVFQMGNVLKKTGKLFIQDILGIENDQARSYMDSIEKLRDPSHIKNYNGKEWYNFLTKEALKVIHSEVVPGVYDLDEWTSRSGTPVENVEKIKNLLEHMPKAIKKHLKASCSEGDWHINMRYILLLATKT